MFQAQLREEIGKAIPCTVECLKDPSWRIRSAGISVLSLLGAYRMCPSVFPLLVS